MTEQDAPQTMDQPREPATGWQAPPPPAAVPNAAGFVYADVPNRVIALIIDGIILAILTTIVTGIVYSIVGSPFTFDLNAGVGLAIVPLLIGAIVSLAISAVYYVYTWTTMRASPGHKILGMQVGNAVDGSTLTQEQAIRRWAVLFAPFSISQVAYVAPTIGMIVGLLTLGYAIYLLWTTAQSPTKQGFHDKVANTVVVKAARSV